MRLKNKVQKLIINKKFWIFTLTIFISIVYFVLNCIYNKSIINNFSDNIIVQTVMLFLAISGFINIFFPFTIRNEISDKDAANISEIVYRKLKKEDEDNKKLQEESEIG